MSTSKFLKDKKKGELSELAELTNLPDHARMKKDDLATALDTHLQSNATTYSSRPELSGYYDSGPKRKSPVKKAVEKITGAVTSEDEAPKTKGRRKTTSATESASTSADTLIATPAKDLVRRASILGSQELSPSSKAITDLYDAGKRRVTSSVTTAYEKIGVTEYVDYVRENLSSPAAIHLFTLCFEAYSLRPGIISNRKMFEFPVIPYITSQKSNAYAPDLFVLLTPEFWAPFSCFLLTSLVLPGIVAYLINLPLKASSGNSHSHGTRRATSSSSSKQFDPFTFFIAKALISYLVYAEHALVGLFSNYTVSTVNKALYGGYTGVVTGAGIGAAVTLYEAVLKK